MKFMGQKLIFFKQIIPIFLQKQNENDMIEKNYHFIKILIWKKLY